jgi:hypothetical protein
MNADLQLQSDKILCNHLNILNNNYDKFNCLMYKKNFIKQQHLDTNNISSSYLNSMFVSKKSCIFTSTEPDEKKWEDSFDINPIYPNFNLNTRIKINPNRQLNCP